VSLAGAVAERLVWTPEDSGRYAELPRAAADEALAQELAALVAPSATDLQLLTEQEGRDQLQDEEQAFEIACVAAGDGFMGGPYLEFLRWQTHGIVNAPAFGRLAQPLIKALLEHRVLSRRAVRAILAEAAGASGYRST
jgi:hypothetical protein